MAEGGFGASEGQGARARFNFCVRQRGEIKGEEIVKGTVKVKERIVDALSVC